MADPDIKAVVIARMEAASPITALTTKIGSVHRRGWGTEPGYMILVKVNGSPGEDNWRESGFHSTRLDMEFYGSDPDRAYELYLTANPILCPWQEGGLNGFKTANCRVAWLDKESGPLESIDEVTRLPFTFASYVAVWSKIP